MKFSLVSGQTFTISGTIEDAASGEGLIGANIFDLNSKEGTSTNTYGFYSISLPTGAVTLSYSYIGFESGKVDFELKKDTVINIALVPSSALEEVVITAEAEDNIEERTTMSTIDLPLTQIKKVPALLGEVDVLKVMQLLPGVQSGGEGQSGLYVRGGSPDQNLILLDGVPVYNASHLFGFFSVFNADAVKDVKLIKGGFPARYGGRLSSVIDISMKEGNNQEVHGSASVGLISSKFTLEAPIIKDRTSFIVSARRTYIDLLARPFIKKAFSDGNEEGVTGYYFYDFNGKINHKIDDKNKLYFSLYTGRDAFYLSQKETSGEERDFQDNNLGWGNLTGALRWNHIWSPKLFSNTTLTYSKYKLGVETEFGSRNTDNKVVSGFGLDYDSGIHDYAAKIDFDYLPNTRNTVRFGIQGIQHHFSPGEFNLTTSNNEKEEKRNVGQKDISSKEFSSYIENDMKLSDDLKINYGLHGSAFLVNDKSYYSLQPRISLRYKLPQNTSIKASFATMRQYINLLAYEGVGLPTDLWLPATDKIKPQDSWQVAMGAAKSLGDIEVSVEGYYKRMKNLVSYKEGSGVFELTDWQTRVTQGNGESYGGEVFLQKKKGKWNGWVGYTLSWTYRKFDDLNFGKRFPFKYDRRHDLSIVGNYELSEGITLSGAWVFGTGNATTLARSKFLSIYGDGLTYTDVYQVKNIKERNNYRMRNYHRLDFGVNFTKKKKHGTRTWSVGAYNAYNRANPFYIYTDENYDPSTQKSKVQLKQSTLFPIIPYVTYRYDF